MITIRDLEEQDLNAYLDLEQEVKNNMIHPEWLGDFTKNDLQRLLKTGGHIYGGYLQDKLIAVGVLMPATKEGLEKLNLDILDVQKAVFFGPQMVHPLYQGKGIQKEIISFLEKRAIQLDYQYVEVIVSPENEISIHNFISCNYEFHKTVELSRGTRNVYVKELQGKLKLYHIDRSGYLREGQKISLQNDIEIRKDFLKKDANRFLKEYFPNGLSFHGRHYFIDGYENKSMGMDIIFEYERRLHYPEKLSRYEALFAFNEDGVKDFILMKELDWEFYKIYEVEYESYERHNMNFVRGWGQLDTMVSAKFYWENLPDYDKNRKPVYEYLLKMPVQIKREVSIEELRSLTIEK